MSEQNVSLETLFDFRQVFSFLIPGFLFFVVLYLIGTSFYSDNIITLIKYFHLSWLKGHDILIAFLALLISFFLGLITNVISMFILYYVGDLYNKLIKTYFPNKIGKFLKISYISKEQGEMLDGLMAEVVDVAKARGIKIDVSHQENLEEIFNRCKDYILQNSVINGKRLQSIEHEIGLYSSSFFVFVLFPIILFFLILQTQIWFLIILFSLSILLIFVCRQRITAGLLNERESAMRMFLILVTTSNDKRNAS